MSEFNLATVLAASHIASLTNTMQCIRNSLAN